MYVFDQQLSHANYSHVKCFGFHCTTTLMDAICELHVFAYLLSWFQKTQHTFSLLYLCFIHEFQVWKKSKGENDGKIKTDVKNVYCILFVLKWRKIENERKRKKHTCHCQYNEMKIVCLVSIFKILQTNSVACMSYLPLKTKFVPETYDRFSFSLSLSLNSVSVHS